jgi:hypothetical protein
MKRVEEELKAFLNYQTLSQLRLLSLPQVKKGDIPSFIACPNYEKAKRKVDQTMERHNKKVASLQEDISAQEAILERANRETRHCNTSDPQSVARHNDWVDRGRAANDKRNDLIDRHNDAIEEAKEKLEQLTQDALLVIDDDIVGALDKCRKVIEKLSGSSNSEDLAGAIEICIMGLRIFRLLEDSIEGNAARKDCRDRISEINQAFVSLCGNEHVRNYFSDVFRKNSYLVQKNGEIYGNMTRILDSVDRVELEKVAQSVAAVLGERIDTKFQYDGVVDPSELDRIIEKITNAIQMLKSSIERTKERGAATKAVAELAASAHQSAETLLESMKANVNAMSNDLLLAGHFACQMIAEQVIDEFYHKDLRPGVSVLRKELVQAIGEEPLDALTLGDDDRYLLERGGAAIKQADLLRLQRQRDKIDSHIGTLSGLIKGCEADISKAGEVPQRNAASCRSSLSGKYLLACIPVIGFLGALGVRGKIKAFQTAFRSNNRIYRELGSSIIAKNKTMLVICLILAVITAGIAAFAAVKTSMAVTISGEASSGAVSVKKETASSFQVAGKLEVDKKGSKEKMKDPSTRGQKAKSEPEAKVFETPVSANVDLSTVTSPYLLAAAGCGGGSALYLVSAVILGGVGSRLRSYLASGGQRAK